MTLQSIFKPLQNITHMTIFSGKYNLNLIDLGKTLLYSIVISGVAALTEVGIFNNGILTRLPTKAELVMAIGVGIKAAVGILITKFISSQPKVLVVDPTKTTVVNVTKPTDAAPVSTVTTETPVIVNTTDVVVNSETVTK